MTVTIKNVKSGEGWGAYVLGRDDVNRPRATIIAGDSELGDTICKSIDYKSGNSVNFVLSFGKEEGVSQEQGRAIAKEFMKSFMHGFNDDEYHLDIVEHTDTDHLHYHARIPKINLLTNTQLKLYWHKTDLSYKKAVIDDICHRHGLVTGAEMKRAIPNPMEKLERVAKWREEHGQKSLDLSTPKIKRETEKKLSEYIAEGVKAGLFSTLTDVENELGILGVNIVNKGYDKSKQFHYLTLENDSGKMRVRGDIYSAEFYELTREDRQESISSNRSFTTRNEELRKCGTDAKQALQRERRKRLKFIEQHYARARARVIKDENARSLEFNQRGNTRSFEFNQRGNEKSLEFNQQGNETSINKIEGRESFASSEKSRGRKRVFDGDEGNSQRIKRGVERHSEEREKSLPNENIISPNDRGNDVRRGSVHTRILYGETSAEQKGRREFFEKALQDNSNRRGIQIDIEGEEIDDSIRREIEQTIEDTRRDVLRGIKEHQDPICERVTGDEERLSIAYERGFRHYREAERSIKEVREHINKLGDKHRRGAIEEVAGAIGEYEFGQSQVKRKVGELEQGKSAFRDGANELQEQVGELVEVRGKFSLSIERCVGKALKKVQEIAKKVAYNKVTQSRRFSP
jgi:hypothetical protein